VTDDNTAALKSGGSGGSGDEPVTGSRFVTDSGTGIKWGALGTVIFTTIFAAFTGVWITAIESLVALQVWLINGLGSFVEDLISSILGGGAGLIVSSWRTAAVQLVEVGPLAPFLAAIEVVVILIIVFAIWNRRPYA
jgi:hypothetical protein